MFSLNKEEKKIVGKLVKAGYECTVRGDGWYIDEDKYDTFAEFWKTAKELAKDC